MCAYRPVGVARGHHVRLDLLGPILRRNRAVKGALANVRHRIPTTRPEEDMIRGVGRKPRNHRPNLRIVDLIDGTLESRERLQTLRSPVVDIGAKDVSDELDREVLVRAFGADRPGLARAVTGVVHPVWGKRRHLVDRVVVEPIFAPILLEDARVPRSAIKHGRTPLIGQLTALWVVYAIDAIGEYARLGKALQQSESIDDRLRIPAEAGGGVIIKRIDVATVLSDERQEEVRAGVACQVAPRERNVPGGLELRHVSDQLVPGIGRRQAHFLHNAVVREDAEVLRHVGEGVRLVVEGVLAKRSLEELREKRVVEHILEVHQEARAAELPSLGAAVEHVGQRTRSNHCGQGRKVLAERDKVALDLDAGILGLEPGYRFVPIVSSGDVCGLPAHHMQRGISLHRVNCRNEHRCCCGGDKSLHGTFSLNVAPRSLRPVSHELRNVLRIGVQRGGPFRFLRP